MSRKKGINKIPKHLQNKEYEREKNRHLGNMEIHALHFELQIIKNAVFCLTLLSWVKNLNNLQNKIFEIKHNLCLIIKDFFFIFLKLRKPKLKIHSKEEEIFFLLLNNKIQ